MIAPAHPILDGLPVLETARLTSRAPSGQDWPGYCGLMTSSRAAFLGGARSTSDAWFGFAAELGHWVIRGYGKFAVTLRDGTPIGLVGPWFPELWPAPELGYFLWDGFEGQGFATEAVAAARDHARVALGWADPISYIHPDNAASIAVVTRLGATRDDNAPQRANRVAYRHPKSAVTPKNAPTGVYRYAH